MKLFLSYAVIILYIALAYLAGGLWIYFCDWLHSSEYRIEKYFKKDKITLNIACGISIPFVLTVICLLAHVIGGLL